MQLYYSATSPYARKVAVVLRETGQLDDVELVGAAGSPLNSSGMPTSHNPLGKIPALVRDDTPAIFDSRVICQFFDDRAGGQLYPTGPRRWEAMTLEAMADGMIDAAILMVYEVRLRKPEMVFNDWVEGQWAKTERALDALENRWISHLSGQFDIGQVAVGCALSYLDFRHSARNWRNGRPQLAAWEAAFAQRDSMIATVPVE